MNIAEAEGNFECCYYRVGSEEEFRISGFEKILLTPIWVLAPLLGKSVRVVIGGSLPHADGGQCSREKTHTT